MVDRIIAAFALIMAGTALVLSTVVSWFAIMHQEEIIAWLAKYALEVFVLIGFTAILLGALLLAVDLRR